MKKTAHIDNYKKMFHELKITVQSTENRILESDSFFSDNANFFTKSFIVIMCAYLESYLKDILMDVIDEMNDRLSKNRVPYNLIKWSLASKSDKKREEQEEKEEINIRFEKFSINIKRKELDEFISGNPYRTEILFNNFGINLKDDPTFKGHKVKLNSIIGKRNAIVHHNDAASDIAPNDIKEYIDFFIEYIENIDNLIVEHIK